MNKRAVLLIETHPGFYHGHMYARCLKGLGYKLYFFNSNDDRRTAMFANSMKAVPVYDLLEALGTEEIVAVILCAAPQLHLQYAEMAFAAGKHVLVEKPIAHSKEHAEEMIGAAKDAGCILGCAEEYAARSAICQATHAVANLGEIVLARAEGGMRQPADFSSQNKYYQETGVLGDLAVHHIRVLRMMFGEIVQILGAHIGYMDDVEMDATMRFRHQAGQESELRVTWMANVGSSPQLVIRGTKGTIEVRRRPFIPSGRIDSWLEEPTKCAARVSKIRNWRLQEFALMLKDWGRVRRLFWEPESASYMATLVEFFSAIDEKRRPTGSASDEQAMEDLKVVEMVRHFCNCKVIAIL